VDGLLARLQADGKVWSIVSVLGCHGKWRPAKKNKWDEPCVHNKAFLLGRYLQQMDFCVNGATKELAKPLPLTQKSICCTLSGSRKALCGGESLAV